MRVSCPQCGTQYALPPAQVKPGLKVRCRRCTMVFSVNPDAAEPTPPPPAKSASAKPSPPKPAPAKPAGEVGLDDLPADPYAMDLDAAPPPPEPSPPAPSPPQPSPPASSTPGGAAALGENLFGDLSTDFAPATSSEDPFAGIDVDVPPRQGPLGGGNAEADFFTGNDGAGADPDPFPTADAPAAWTIRTLDGNVRDFPDLEGVRAFMAANPAFELELSHDGGPFRPSSAYLGTDADAEAPPRSSSSLGSPLSGTPITSSLRASALRTGVSKSVASNAGFVWGAAMLLATLVVAATAVVTLQLNGVVDLSGVIPFDRIGLSMLAGPAHAGGRVAAGPAKLTPAERYRKAVAKARAAEDAGRLVDAVVGWLEARSVRETPEVLDGLAKTYALLGDEKRAAETRSRLAELRHRDEAKGP